MFGELISADQVPPYRVQDELDSAESHAADDARNGHESEAVLPVLAFFDVGVQLTQGGRIWNIILARIARISFWTHLDFVHERDVKYLREATVRRSSQNYKTSDLQQNAQLKLALYIYM